VSYWVLPIGRGRGTAPVALRALTQWAFDEVGVPRAELAQSTSNPASCLVATKADFLPEGTARRRTLHPDGWHFMHLHARLNPASDWT
jgi:[ribosomal protein S5]-alanine N-acetyltransferase